MAEQRLSRDFAAKLRAWHPSGFSVYLGRPIDSDDRPALERLAAYILRPVSLPADSTTIPSRVRSTIAPPRASAAPWMPDLGVDGTRGCA